MMAGKLMGWDRSFALLRYGDRFRETRKMFAQLIGSRNNVARFSEQVENETARMLLRVVKEPNTVAEQARK